MTCSDGIFGTHRVSLRSPGSRRVSPRLTIHLRNSAEQRNQARLVPPRAKCECRPFEVDDGVLEATEFV
jgi:hypothetical protein